jgi:hypothetical protein
VTVTSNRSSNMKLINEFSGRPRFGAVEASPDA